MLSWFKAQGDWTRTRSQRGFPVDPAEGGVTGQRSKGVEIPCEARRYRTMNLLTDVSERRCKTMPDGMLEHEAGTEGTEGGATLRATRRSLPIALLRAREAVMSHFRPMLAQHDVSEQQWRVLRLLHEAGMLDASDVAERAFILAPSLTRMIRSLEERSFITKHKDRGDGRRVLLKIAPAGEAIIHEVLPDSRRIYEALEKRFGAERLDGLVDLLDELASLRSEAGSSLLEE